MGAPPPGGDAPPGSRSRSSSQKTTGKSGDPKQHAIELAEKVRDLSSDLVEAVRALTGEQAEMGGEGSQRTSRWRRRSSRWSSSYG